MKISVRAHTNSSVNKIKKDEVGTYHVYVTARAVKNQANRAIISSLANYFRVNKNQIFLDIGSKQKDKVFTILKK